MTTNERLKSVIPGQSPEWYARIAAEIDAGRMPMPTLEPIEDTTYSYSKSDLNPVHRIHVVTVPPRSPRHEPAAAAKPIYISDRLIELCNGNRATAQRLVTSNLQKNPSKTAQWANDKSVWDLERDRGAR